MIFLDFFQGGGGNLTPVNHEFEPVIVIMKFLSQ